MSLGEPARVTYDQHDLFYVYGDLDRFERVAREHGMSEGRLHIPAPHMHQFTAEYDREEARLFQEYAWLHFPLEPIDDP